MQLKNTNTTATKEFFSRDAVWAQSTAYQQRCNMAHKVEMNTCWFTWEGWVIRSGADPEELWDCIKSQNEFQKKRFQARKEGSRRMP